MWLTPFSTRVARPCARGASAHVARGALVHRRHAHVERVDVDAGSWCFAFASADSITLRTMGAAEQRVNISVSMASATLRPRTS